MLLTGLLIAVSLAEALIFWLLHAYRRDAQRAQQTPLCVIAQLGPADVGREVAVYGRLTPTTEAVSSPVTGERCSYLRLRVEWLRKGARHGSWHTDLERVDAPDVAVVDTSGAQLPLASLAQAEVVLDRPEHSISRFAPGQHPELTRALLRNLTEQAAEHGWQHDHRLRFRHAHLPVASLVYARGRLQLDARGQLQLAGSTRPGARLWLIDRGPEELARYFRGMRGFLLVPAVVLGLAWLALAGALFARSLGSV